MRERGPTLTPLTAVVTAGGVLGLCCGLPVLFTLGVAGAVAGLSVSSSALLGLGLVLAVLGGARWMRRPRHTTPAAVSPDTAPPGTPGRTPEATTTTTTATTGDHR